MRAGKRQSLISVMKKGPGKDDYGQPSPTWIKVAEMWAELEQVRGWEQAQARERQSVAVYRAVVDYLEGRAITADMKVVLDGMDFDIMSVHHDFNGRRNTTLQLGQTLHGA